MVSVLICSVNQDLLQQVQNNIAHTIGVKYELLVHDNRINPKGLCEVYNLLAEKSMYLILCFVHEDVIFTSKNWGKGVLQTFSNNQKIGVLGIAGSKYKSSSFSGWFTGIKEFDCVNVYHNYPHGMERQYSNPKGEEVEEVVCLDGVFLCCKREVWTENKFDEQSLKGFHLYDLDFSLRAARHCTVAVTYGINLTHITTGGDFGDTWVKTSIAYHQQKKKDLPFTKEFVPSPAIELSVTKNTLDVLKTHSISIKNKLKWVRLQELYKHPVLYYSILKFLVYKPLRLRYIHKLFK